MTTHENYPDTMATTGRGDRHAGLDTPMDPPPVPADAPTGAAVPDERSTAPAAESVAAEDRLTPTPGSATGQSPTPAATAPEQWLFDDSELTGLRARWTEVQSAFVDDPRDCVQKADGLVGDVVDRLTREFSTARSGLEEQWSRGEQVSTEDLRVALKRYREFFERLLAV